MSTETQSGRISPEDEAIITSGRSQLQGTAEQLDEAVTNLSCLWPITHPERNRQHGIDAKQAMAIHDVGILLEAITHNGPPPAPTGLLTMRNDTAAQIVERVRSELDPETAQNTVAVIMAIQRAQGSLMGAMLENLEAKD